MLYSHPTTLLFDHSKEVIDNVSAKIQMIELPVGYFTKMEIIDLAIIIAALHDLGKATSYFQIYIKDTTAKLPFTNNLKAHSVVGAVYAYYALSMLPKWESMDIKKKKLLQLIAALVILRHHGNLHNLTDERKYLRDALKDIENKNSVLQQQIQSIDTKSMDQLLTNLSQKTKLNFPSWTSFTQLTTEELSQLNSSIRKTSKYINGISDICESKNTKQAKSAGEFPYYITHIIQLLFSLLQMADKTSAMQKFIINRDSRNYYTLLAQFYTAKFTQKNTLNLQRSLIFDEAVTHAKNLTTKSRIYGMESPTGSGKTFANIGWAFALRDHLFATTNTIYRIVYVLPFTSIIDQTYEVIQNMLSYSLKIVPSNILLKHHYLSELKYSLENDTNNDFTPNQAAFYIEGWNSEIIVTTLNQFFHSVFTNKKKSLQKYHAFSNTIFIFDEIQSIPIKYWELVNTYFPKFLEYTNSFLLFSTATMPGIMNNSLPIVSKTGLALFTNLNRTVMQYEDPITLQDLLPTLKAKNAFVDSFLFVFNTIKSSQYIFEEILNDPIFDDYQVFYLSSNLIPAYRKQLLSNIKSKLQHGDKIILVSTQVIEAGVDLSFVHGFRDLAPMDSIIQTVGRINRSGEYGNNAGKLWIIPLKENERERLFATYIYDLPLLLATQEILQRHQNIAESNFRSVINEYFTLAKTKISGKPSRNILQNICQANYKKVADEFQLIDPQEYKYPVFIVIDETAEKLWQKYEDIYGIKDWMQKRDEYLKIKPLLANYIVNTPKKYINADFEDRGWVYVLRTELVQYYYDTNLGIGEKKIDSLVF